MYLQFNAARYIGHAADAASNGLLVLVTVGNERCSRGKLVFRFKYLFGRRLVLKAKKETCGGDQQQINSPSSWMLCWSW